MTKARRYGMTPIDEIARGFDEFVLVESALHPHGARYSVVERFRFP